MKFGERMKNLYQNGHKWLVLLTSGLVTLMDYGVMFSLGSLFIHMLDTFNETRSTTAVVQSLLVAAAVGSGVIVGCLITRFGVTPVTFVGAVLVPTGFIMGYFATSFIFLNACSVISGLGISCMHMSGIIAIGKSFRGRQQTFAVSIQSLGTPIGGFIYPSLINSLFNSYSLRGTFLVLGGILLNNLACALIFSYATRQSIDEKKTPSGLKKELVSEERVANHDINERSVNGSFSNTSFNSNQTTSGIAETSLLHDNPHSLDNTTRLSPIKEIEPDFERDNNKRFGLTSFIFLMLAAAMSVLMANLASFLTLYQDMMKSKGFTILESNIFYMCYCAFNVCSRFFVVIPSIFPKVSLFFIPLFGAICGCFGQLVFLLTSSYSSAMIGMALTGTCDGSTISAMQGISFKILRSDKQAIGIGIISTMIGFLSIGAGPAYGAIRESTESYDVALMIASGLYAMSSVMFVLCILRSNAKTMFVCRKQSYAFQ